MKVLFPKQQLLLLVLASTLWIASAITNTGQETCGKVLFLFDQVSVRHISEGACDDECTFYPVFLVLQFFGLRSDWDAGSCAGATNVVLLDGPTTDFSISSCDNEKLIVQGNLVENLAVGNKVIYTDGVDLCSDCSPIYRRIVSIQDVDTEGTKELTTSFLTIADVFGKTSFDSDSQITSTQVEPSFDCSDNTENQRLLLQDLSLTEPPSAPDAVCAPRWLTKNDDGRCSFTNCFVGENGDPSDCFSCKSSCDNGCAAKESIFNFGEDFFGLYDFGEACCNHDHCWSSNLGRQVCDLAFYNDMIRACPPIADRGVFDLTPDVPRLCRSDAKLFYFLVSTSLGDGPYAAAQQDQRDHELTPVCAVKCPTTQRSGGQGTTTFTIDLLRTSGSFPLYYNMYRIPDELTITYEGQEIFATGGLVSWTRSTSVEFSGSTTVIEVTINAPGSATRWHVFVGCPSAP